MYIYLLTICSQWLPSPFDYVVTHSGIVVGLLLVCYAINFITKHYLLKGIYYFTKKTKTTWDDALFEAHVFDRLTHIAPALFVYLAIPFIYSDFAMILGVTRSICQAYMVLVSVLVLDSGLNVFELLLQRSYLGKKVSFRSYIQVIKLIFYFFATISILSTLLNKSPWVFLSGLGALTAVLMLVFKDTILGFAASIQLATNKMLMSGDWVEMPEFGADGDVIEVGLNSVKVQNWDKTITTIPTHKLVSHSFKNWRGMSESGGRRIKRSIALDMNTVTFCTDAMIKKCKKLHLLKDYVERKEKEVSTFNNDHHIDTTHPANGKRLTNLGMFRAYIKEYLKQHPKVHQNMTLLVRQLQPTEKGIPIELYLFSNDQNWVNYECLQADIFDHILAILPEFDLSVFQLATGLDFRAGFK